MDLMSISEKNLKTSFNGKDGSGEVRMNEPDAAPVTFAATSVAAANQTSNPSLPND